MTKTKDTRLQTWTCAICGQVLYTPIHHCREAKLVYPETPKRCDECKWWAESSWDELKRCDKFELIVSAENIFRPPADFYCKYWEKKEDK